MTEENLCARWVVAPFKRLLRWLYRRYASVGDPRLVCATSQAAALTVPPMVCATSQRTVLAVPPVGRRFRIMSKATGRVVFDSDHTDTTKKAFHGMTGVELWDGNRRRTQR